MNILFAEDEPMQNELVATYLRSEGFGVYPCLNGQQAFEEFEKNQIDLILTDIMMPVMDGFALAEKIKRVSGQTPIIFLTAKEDKASKQLGYKLGIDDYITKPFDLDELVMKLRAWERRLAINKSSVLEVGNFVLDKEERSATVSGEQISLTVREFDILFKMLSYPKKTFTRSALMEEFWDYDSSATSRTVDVYMAKLRDKTSGCDGFEILTVHGLGYKVVLK